MVTPAAPASPLLFQHTGGSFGEGGDALGAALLGKRVSALAGQLVVGQRFLPGLCQRDQGETAESQLTATATDDEPLNPAPGSAGLDEEVQSVSIGVSSRGAERRRAAERAFWGWRPVGLVLGRTGAKVLTVSIPPLYGGW